MVRLLLSAALIAASATVANADPAPTPSAHHHHHAKKAPPVAAAPAEDPSIPDQMRGWFEGAVENILSGVDPKDSKTSPDKK